MRRSKNLLMAIAGLPVLLGAVAATAGTEDSERLLPVENVKAMRSPARVISVDGFLYEDFESVADGDTELPAGWVTTSTPGLATDKWAAGTLGRGNTPLNGVSGFKYAYILGNRETADSHDAWLFSPGVNMRAGEEYTIEFFAMMPPVSGSDVMEKLDVTLAASQSADAVIETLEVIENDNDYWRYYGYTFTPETSGTYYVGFHSVSPAGSNSTAIDDLKVTNGKTAIFAGLSDINLGFTDTRCGEIVGSYSFRNDGGSPLEISLGEVSPELEIIGVPATLDEYQEGTLEVRLTNAEAGDYEGYFILNTNDPTLSSIKVNVTASIKQAVVSGFCMTDFEQGSPEGWDFCIGSGNVSSCGGYESSRAWYCTTFYQTMGDCEALGGVHFTTNYIEMGDNPEIKFMYQFANTDMLGTTASGPTDADVMKFSILVSDDNGKSWNDVYTVEPGGEREHNPVLDFQEVAVKVPQYAGKTCRVRVIFSQVKGSSTFNPVRILVDNVSVGTKTPTDLSAKFLSGNTTLSKGTEYTFLSEIENKGTESVSKYIVRLIDTSDNSVVSTSDGVAVEPSGTVSVPLKWTPDTEGAVHLVAEVVSDDDKTSDNNFSYPLHAIVIPEGNSGVIIGTEGERMAGMYYPVNYYSVDSRSQSLYYANEIGINKGVVNSMVFKTYLDGDFFAEPVSFYIGETDLNDFADGMFVDSGNFTKVFEGSIRYEDGENEIVIPFDTPYEYKGGNIVIMGERYGKEFIMGKYFIIRQTLDKETKRSINASSFISGGLEEATPSTATVYPEICFNMVKAASGSISGRVVDAAGPVADALVKVAGTQLSRSTDADGRFYFPEVAADNVAIEIEKHGYYNMSSDVRTVEQGKNTEYDITLKALPQYKIEGMITSKTSGEPVEGVRISLKGYDDFQTFSDADGHYEIAGIRGDTGSDYTVLVSSDFFISQGELLKIDSDAVKDYVLCDKILKVHNVKATKAGANVNVTWDSPMPEFAHDSGVPVDYIGWSHGQPNVIVGSVYHNHAKIKEISWYTTDEYGWHGNFTVYIFGLNEDGSPDVKNILYTAKNVDFSDNAWSTHVLGNEIEADGFMIAVGCDGFLGIGITEPTDDYPFEEGQCFYAGDNYERGIFPMSNFMKVHVMLRAYGVNLGDASKVSALRPKNAISRPASDYKVYRFADGDAEDKWTLISSTDELSYYDENYALLEQGKYRYAVTAVYGEIDSTPMISDIIEKTQSGIETVSADGLISITPNPFKSALRVSNPEIIKEISFFTTAGTLSKRCINVGSYIDTTDLAPGLYIVNLRMCDDRIVTVRLLKSK